MPYPYLREGQRVRITEGPLAGVEGILVRNRPKQGLLVLSVELLQRSVAVEIECDAVDPVDTPARVASACRRKAAAGTRLPREDGSHEDTRFQS